MQKYLKSFIVVREGIEYLSVSSINFHLSTVVDTVSLELSDFVIECQISDAVTDIKFNDESDLAPVFLAQNGDYWFKCLNVNNDAFRLFRINFINKNSGNMPNNGVFNSGNYVGNLDLSFIGLYESVVEIESLKVDYLSEYRYMLADIDSVFSELVTRSSSFLRTRLIQSDVIAERFAYSKFAFIKNLLRPDRLPLWIEIIKNRPYSQLENRSEKRDIWEVDYLDSDDYLDGLLQSDVFRSQDGKYIPLEVKCKYHEDTVNTKENQFVKFFIVYLKDLVISIKDNISKEKIKLNYEVDNCSGLLVQLLNDSFFYDISDISVIPYNSQVLHKKYPYNLIFKSYNDFLLSTKYNIDIYNERFLAGQKDVAKLYEYWIFISIFKALNDKFENDFRANSWLTFSEETLNVNLSESNSKLIEYQVNDKITLRLYFNKSYKNNTSIYYGRSYSHELKPDVSLELFKADKFVACIHFDAKYKEPQNGSYVVDDLNKMHAYKDGIMGTVGAYALCLSSEEMHFFQEEKVDQMHKFKFPSIGSFPMNINKSESEDEIDKVVSIIDKFVNYIGEEREGIFERNRKTSYRALDRIVGDLNEGDQNEV